MKAHFDATPDAHSGSGSEAGHCSPTHRANTGQTSFPGAACRMNSAAGLPAMVFVSIPGARDSQAARSRW